MWPIRVGGHVGPPTPLTPEVTLSGLSPQEPSPAYLGTSCVVATYYYALPFANRLAAHRNRPYMPLEPRNFSRRTYERMNRIQHPYRQGISDRLNRYRPTLPSLREEESTEQRTTDQRSNIEVQDRASRLAFKRNRRNSSYPSVIRVDDNLQARFPRSYPNLQRIPTPEEWLRMRQSTRQSHWQHADAPEIIITSDVQLQTDDNETGFNSSHIRGPMESSSSNTSGSSGSAFETSSTQTEIDVSINNEEVPELVGAYIDVETESYTPSSHIIQHVESGQTDESYSSPNNKVSVITDWTGINKSLRAVSAARAPARGRRALPAPSAKARQVANSVIKHARNNKTINEKALHCLNCDLFPVLPVTGLCGHTRCTKCIEDNGDCPCGAVAPKDLHVNTAIQYLIGKMLSNESPPRRISRQDRGSSHATLRTSSNAMPEMQGGSLLRLRRSMRPARGACARLTSSPDFNAKMPMSPQVQFEYGRRLLAGGRYRDAAPHFARVAASSARGAKAARSILAQIIMILAEGHEPRRVARELFRAVRLQAAGSWLKPADLECVLCYHTYSRPVTTPCGHTYCRTCIERALDYRKACALCLRPLEDFFLATTRETEFMAAALESIDASQPVLPPDPDVIPIFVCTVAYPSIPCPLFIFDPRYWLMIRRVLESGSRKFGMVAYEKDRNYSDYGTVLEVCDCVHLEDGRSFLSTVGVSRFRVIERDVRDGCDVARIQPLIDITPTEEEVILDMRCLGSQILYKALLWLNGMNRTVRTEIETAFGEIPQFEDENDPWWETSDGPAWLWWLIAILPLRSEIKILILSTKNLMKRMMAVSRTLEAIDQVAITTTSTSECEIRSALTNAEEWLERGS